MVQNLSQSGNSASPGVNALGTPGLGGLGIEGITPSALHNISTPLAFAMSRSDSELRLANSATKRNEDEERRAKMRKVLKSIGRPKGRVSEEGIVRLARRVGLVSDIDDEKLTQDERERKVGNRSFSVAGDSVIVTIDLRDQIPQSVEVNGDVPDTDEAARVLFRDLRDSSNVALTANLGRFASNLSYLAQMDRLKKETDTDCFAALDGLYKNLRRLHAKESDNSVERAGAQRAGMVATCKKSGKPTMHARDSLGLSLDYWRQNRFLGEDEQSASSKMDLDEAEHGGRPKEGKDLWTLSISAEKSNTAIMPYAPLRVSDQWLPAEFTLPAEDSGEGISWLEPSSSDNGAPKPYFNATLDPPVVLPYNIADAILKTFNVHSIPDVQNIPSYLSLLLSNASGSRVPSSSVANELSSITSLQDVLSVSKGDQTIVQHRYTLDNAKPDFGFLLRELPFSHPKQLVELMPTLRQWAAFGVLLSQSLDSSVTHESSTKDNASDQPISLDNILNSSPPAEAKGPIPVNIALSTQPALNITFRSASIESPIANLHVQISRNADVSIEIYEGFDFSDEGAKAKAEARMAKALDVCWDLGIWIEWVRAQYG